MTVCIGYISPGTVATSFHESVVNLVLTDSEVVGQISMISGPRISGARNDLVRVFLDHPRHPDWLFMVDSDMVFAQDIVQRFLDAANEKIRPVIGGLCFGGGRVGIPFPTLYALCDPKRNGGKLTKVITDYPKDALAKVDATGAAAIFIHRDVFLQMQDKFKQDDQGYENPHPWFAESVHKGYEYGEDWAFCMRLRSLGIPLYVHTGIKLGHQKSWSFDEEFYEFYRRCYGNEGRPGGA